MKEYESGAYFVSRNSYKRTARSPRPRRGRGAAGVLIAVLLLLTAAICALVFLLPRMTDRAADGAPTFKGKTFYFLATAQYSENEQALLGAQYAVERGGAGYVYNDGSYRIVAAVYDRETDAKTLVSVNADSHYFELSVPQLVCGSGEKTALEYLTGEWFATVFNVATELDRGNISDAAAEYAALTACRKLESLSDGVESGMLKRALMRSVEFARPQSRSVLSYIRYIHVRAIIEAVAALDV